MSAVAIDLYLFEEFSKMLSKVQKMEADLFCVDNDLLLGKIMLSSTDIQNDTNSLKRNASPIKCLPAKKVNRSLNTHISKVPAQSTQPQGFVSQFDPMAKRDVSSLVNVLVNSQTNQKIYQCTFCSYQSGRGPHAKRHIEAKHLPPSVLYPCLTCGNNFKMKSALKLHYVRVHKMPDHAAKAMLTPP